MYVHSFKCYCRSVNIDRTERRRTTGIGEPEPVYLAHEQKKKKECNVFQQQMRLRSFKSAGKSILSQQKHNALIH